MFSRTERHGPANGLGRAAGRDRRSALVRRRRWWAPAWAALLGASGCSGGDELIAKITLEAGAPDVVTPCVPIGYPATDMGLDLYFIIDHSLTLDFDEWRLLQFGFVGLFQTPEFAGMGVGFTVYPPVPQSCIEACGPVPTCNCFRECGCDERVSDLQLGCQCREWSPSCNEYDYYLPTSEIARLNDGQQQQLIDLGKVPPTPSGWPALRPALLGSLLFRNDWEASHDGRSITQVLVSASDISSSFSECNERTIDLERVLSGPETPKTYVVAVNDFDSPEYDRLAVAGGGMDTATRIRVSPIASPRFVDLVTTIRNREGRCEYLLPPPSPEFDYRNVNLTAQSGGALFPKVRDRSACEGEPQGWYYDRPISEQPTRLIACEGACKTLHGSTGQAAANAVIQLGCPTVVDAGP